MSIITVGKAHYKEHAQFETMNTIYHDQTLAALAELLQNTLHFCATFYEYMATTKLRLRQTKSLELHPVSVEIGVIARWHSFKSRFTGSPSTDTRQGNAFVDVQY